MHSLPGRLARRTLICAGLSLLMAVPAVSFGAVDPVVVSTGSRFVPGDASDPTSVVVVQGGGLTYMNIDLVEDHSVTSDDIDTSGMRLFDSPRLRFRQSASVTGIASLAPGTYGFHCSIHESMRGDILVVPR